MNEILILYYSRQGSTAALARQICRGVEGVAGMRARLRTVPPVAATSDHPDPAVPDEGPPYATHEDLVECGGQETTLLSMMLPLLHHGMYLVGLPYTEQALTATQSGGTPYGASHTAGASGRGELTDAERELARALGARVATLASRLHGNS